MGYVWVVGDRLGIQGSSSCGPLQGWRWGEGQSPPSTSCGRPGLGSHCLNWQPQASAAARPSALETAGGEPPTVGKEKKQWSTRAGEAPLCHSADKN